MLTWALELQPKMLASRNDKVRLIVTLVQALWYLAAVSDLETNNLGIVLLLQIRFVDKAFLKHPLNRALPFTIQMNM